MLRLLGVKTFGKLKNGSEPLGTILGNFILKHTDAASKSALVTRKPHNTFDTVIVNIHTCECLNHAEGMVFLQGTYRLKCERGDVDKHYNFSPSPLFSLCLFLEKKCRM